MAAKRVHRPLTGLIHHGDRGSQYAAVAFQQYLPAWSVTAGMSCKGNPCDNALAESFVATFRTECFGNSTPDQGRRSPHDFRLHRNLFPPRAAATAPSAIARRSTSKNKCSPPNKNNQDQLPANSPTRVFEERSNDSGAMPLTQPSASTHQVRP